MTRQEIKRRSFNLRRWFAVLSFICITLISALAAYGLSRFLTENLLHRDAVVTAEFVQSIAQTADIRVHFGELDLRKVRPHLDGFFRQIAHLPDVARANVYSRNRTIVWSNDDDLVGRRFDHNQELEQALNGTLALKTGQVSATEKSEHVSFSADVERFVENYIPIHSASGGVVAVVEVYKIPRVLYATIKRGNFLVAISAVVAGLFLYGALFGIVHRAGRLVAEQHAELVEADRMARVGEMTAAIAHGIRNPLAAIRSSAELASETGDESVRELSDDIVREVDQVERWIRELLSYSRAPENGSNAGCGIADVIQNSLSHFEDRMRQQSVSMETEVSDGLPEVQGDPGLLSQALSSLIANALEAMPHGGQLSLRAVSRRDTVAVEVTDTGPGIPSELLGNVFEPLVTHKRNGLGMGLPLARRAAERFGGSLELASGDGRGCRALLTLPALG